MAFAPAMLSVVSAAVIHLVPFAAVASVRAEDSMAGEEEHLWAAEFMVAGSAAEVVSMVAADIVE